MGCNGRREFACALVIITYRPAGSQSIRMWVIMGPLAGVRVLEVGGLGAAPYGCMLLADMGAEVVRIDRSGDIDEVQPPVLRNRRRIALELGNPDGTDVLLALVDRADILVEAYRPGVAERLGFGPDICLRRNQRLVYGRLTGWGQDGPLAQAAGHDVNYIALTGLLHMIGTPAAGPVPPLNIAGDLSGGMLMAFGLVSAMYEASRSGRGQVVDIAMVDSAVSLLSGIFGMTQSGIFVDRPGESLLCGAAPYYGVFATADGKYISLASCEPKFLRLLIEKLDLPAERFAAAGYPAADDHIRAAIWPALREELATIFRGRTRSEWCALLEGTDVCFAPVLSLEEAPAHPHNVAREAFIEIDGVLQNRPAPRFSRTVPSTPVPPRTPDADRVAVLRDWGVVMAG